LKIKGIIFDFDGTLLDSITDIAIACNNVLEANGLPIHAIEKYVDFIGNGARRIVQLALPGEWTENETTVDFFLEKFKKAYNDNLVVHSKLFDGISEMLSFLNNKGIPIAINTNKPHEQTLLIAEKLLSDHKFEVIFGQKDETPRKPDPAGALMIAETLGFSPSEMLYVGDSDVDVKTALAAKMKILGVEWGYCPKQKMIDAGAKEFVSSAQELKNMMA